MFEGLGRRQTPDLHPPLTDYRVYHGSNFKVPPSKGLSNQESTLRIPYKPCIPNPQAP